MPLNRRHTHYRFTPVIAETHEGNPYNRVALDVVR